MNTDNATKMTKALSERGVTSIVVASGDILIATAKAKIHAADKIRTILPSSAKFDGKKWATTYEGQYVTDPAEIARLRDESKTNEETALRLGKISGKGESQEVFLKSGPVVNMDKKAISEYMKGLDKTDKARERKTPAAESLNLDPKVKTSEGTVGPKVTRNVTKATNKKANQDEGEAGRQVTKNVEKKADPKVVKGKKIRDEAPSAKTATAGSNNYSAGVYPREGAEDAEWAVFCAKTRTWDAFQGSTDSEAEENARKIAADRNADMGGEATAAITKTNDGLTFRVKAPFECKDAEIAAFIALVTEGGKVDTAGLEERVNAAALLGFVYKGKELIGTAAVKNPLDTYREQVEQQANTELPKNRFPYEIGWIFVKPEFRNQATLQKLQMLLSNKAFALHRGMFATTKEINKANIKYLEDSRFKKAGDTWMSPRDGSPMVLYTREANASSAGFCGFYSLMAP